MWVHLSLKPSSNYQCSCWIYLLYRKAYQETAMMAQSFSVTDERFMLIKCECIPNFAYNLESASQKWHSVQTTALLYTAFTAVGNYTLEHRGPPYSHLTVFINSLKFKESCWFKAVCKQGFPLCSHWKVIQQEGVCVCVCVCACVRACVQIPFGILISEKNVPITVKFTGLLRACLWWHLV